MNPQDLPNLRSRRDFVRQAACAAVGTLSLASTIRDLRFINTAAANQDLTGYRALVCLFLSGGNDANNLIIPAGSGYAAYKAARQNLAIPEASLLPITSLVSDGNTYGLHPATTKIQQLFMGGKLAFLNNVGPLVHPMTRAQYQKNSVPRPPQLFSHSDQVTHWQTSLPDQPPRTGWGGRIADLLHPAQYALIDGVPTANSAKIALCTSLAGANTYQVGNSFAQYHVSRTGAVTLTSGMASEQLQAIKDILALTDPNIKNLQRGAYAGVTKSAIDTGDLLTQAISATSAATYWNPDPFPATTLGDQLKMIARLIEAGPRESSGLNMKRQIFFCSVGGYDTHTSQVQNNGNTEADRVLGAHRNLLFEVSEAMYAFQKAMEKIGRENDVTLFTASDFGRTLPTNGQGSDHGWGSHHMIMGGAVKGQQTYGTFPVLQVNGPDDTSTGRWIPRVSVDEYSATLAKWFGVSPADLPTVFPNLGHFANPNLGFME